MLASSGMCAAGGCASTPTAAPPHAAAATASFLQGWRQWRSLLHCRSGAAERRSMVTHAQQSGHQSAGAVCLASASSPHNACISVVRMPDSEGLPPQLRGATILTLDASGNVHSVVRHANGRSGGSSLTGAYWDVFALLPPLIPEGPVSILGLAAGTVAWLLHARYPALHMHGWELDGAVVQLARQHMGLAQLEQRGCLEVHVGDALQPAAAVSGGSAGIVVDLFAEGQLVPQLTQASSWAGMRQRLAPGGRVMANLGAAPVQGTRAAEAARTLAALDAMAEAFEGQVACASCTLNGTANLLALSGAQPAWAASAVEPELQAFTQGGRFTGWLTAEAYKQGLQSAFFDW